MQVMLKKYYAQVHSNQRNSLINLDEYIPLKIKNKRTKSQGNYNNLTKTSEKSLKSLTKYKKRSKPKIPNNMKHKSPIKIKRAIKSESSYIHKNIIIKQRTSNATIKRINKSAVRFDTSIRSLSDSYDILLQQFKCGDELKSSLKKLVQIEKLSLKKKFSSNHFLLSKKNLLVHNFYNNSMKN